MLTNLVKRQIDRMKMNRPLCRYCGHKITDPSSKTAYDAWRLKEDIKQDKLLIYSGQKWFKRPDEFKQLLLEREELKKICKGGP